MMATLLAGGGHGPSISIEGFYLIDFLVFVGILVYFLRKPLAAYITERRATLTVEITEAQKLREEAEAKLKDYETRLDSLEDEIARVMEEARQAAENERVRILNDANAAAERLTKDAQTRIEQATRRLEHELRIKMVELSVEKAEELIATKVDDRVRRRHVTEYISSLESQAGQL
jgi:F-type H+-transporting ATPase subunit b